ncbi:MAG: homoserine kinase [Alphaproteobacteria bacterium]|jgi:homoserine kinase type II|nr:homoserine kinase [Alphaproteobacteria bacterium]
MAVYTEVTDEALSAFLTDYDIGQGVSLKGIAEGVENTNYMLFTEQGPFILTLYEKRVEAADLPFFLGLMEHLAEHNVACPTPIHGRDGAVLRELCGRPAAVTSFLSGVSPVRPSPKQCAGVGAALARLHLAGSGYTTRRANALSHAGWRQLFELSAPGANDVEPGLADMLDREIDHLDANWPTDLPAGVIHADLFPDNVFFERERLTGLIDFYFACNDYLIYDLAICLNAWCFEPDLSFNVTKARLMTAAYRRERSISQAEIDALPLLTRGAAVRFLVTRLYDWLNQVEGALVKPKDPMEYVRKLRFHQSVLNTAAYGIE